MFNQKTRSSRGTATLSRIIQRTQVSPYGREENEEEEEEEEEEEAEAKARGEPRRR